MTLVQMRPRSASATSAHRVRPRDMLGDREPSTAPVTALAGAGHAMHYRRLGALPVTGEQGGAESVPALAR